MKFSILRRLLLLFLLSPTVLLGQDTASITGTVTDSTGAAVPDAQLALISPEHGVSRSARSNSTGEYLFAALPIGAYNLTVTSPGFKKYDAKGILLRVGQKARNDVQLQVGSTNTEVTVQGESVAQVETQTNELAGTITGKEISQLQLNGRVFTQLVTLTPGVSNQTGSSEGQVGITANTNFSVNGGRLEIMLNMVPWARSRWSSG